MGGGCQEEEQEEQGDDGGEGGGHRSHDERTLARHPPPPRRQLARVPVCGCAESGRDELKKSSTRTICPIDPPQGALASATQARLPPYVPSQATSPPLWTVK